MDSKKLANSLDGTNDNLGQHFVQSDYFHGKLISMEDIITMNYCNLVQLETYYQYEVDNSAWNSLVY